MLLGPCKLLSLGEITRRGREMRWRDWLWMITLEERWEWSRIEWDNYIRKMRINWKIWLIWRRRLRYNWCKRRKKWVKKRSRNKWNRKNIKRWGELYNLSSIVNLKGITASKPKRKMMKIKLNSKWLILINKSKVKKMHKTSKVKQKAMSLLNSKSLRYFD